MLSDRSIYTGVVCLHEITSGKTEKKNLLNSMALFASSVALASPKWTVFGIKVVFLDVSYTFIYFELVFKSKETY